MLQTVAGGEDVLHRHPCFVLPSLGAGTSGLERTENGVGVRQTQFVWEVSLAVKSNLGAWLEGCA